MTVKKIINVLKKYECVLDTDYENYLILDMTEYDKYLDRVERINNYIQRYFTNSEWLDEIINITVFYNNNKFESVEAVLKHCNLIEYDTIYVLSKQYYYENYYLNEYKISIVFNNVWEQKHVKEVYSWVDCEEGIVETEIIGDLNEYFEENNINIKLNENYSFYNKYIMSEEEINEVYRIEGVEL